MPVFVLGMHRSGTSAMSRLVNLLGIPLGKEEDLMSGRPDNPTGHWESQTLYKFNEALLSYLGGNWCLPPKVEKNWWNAPRLQPLHTPARQIFESIYDTSKEWLWKDPRNCITLPFWMEALKIKPAIILIHRNPLEVHASLEKRNELSLPVVSWVWEMYHRHALVNLEGLPVFTLGYETLLADPHTLLGNIIDFLVKHGVLASPPKMDLSVVDSFLSKELRHSAFTSEDVANSAFLTNDQKTLYSYLCALPQAQETFVSASVPEPTENDLFTSWQHIIGATIAQLKVGLDQTTAQAQGMFQRLKQLQHLTNQSIQVSIGDVYQTPSSSQLQNTIQK